MKARGRPKLAADDTSVPLSVRLPTKQFQASQKQAAAARLTLQEWIRLLLKRGTP